MIIPRLVVQASKFVINPTLLSHISAVNCNTTRLISLHRNYLAARLYTDKHEWIEVNGNIGIVGISQYAQEALGDVVYAQLPDVNTNLKQHDECGALESVKAASELYSPVSGCVKEKNSEVENTPSLINTSCYVKGWLFKVELTDDKEIKGLMTEEQYTKFLKSNDH